MYNKIALISDLHLDSWSGDLEIRAYFLIDLLTRCRDHEPDLIVIAGDVFNGSHGKQFTLSSGNPPIVVVTGNHDLYGRDAPEYPDFIVNEQLVLTTLWTGFHKSLYPRNTVFRNIADGYYIAGMTADKMVELFNLSWEQIKKENKEIVITHFPPFQESIAPQYRNDPLNSYFINDMQKMFEEADLQTKLWLCGHTHHRHSYYMGDTLVACNPCGYRGENYQNFSDYQPMILYKEGELWIQQ